MLNRISIIEGEIAAPWQGAAIFPCLDRGAFGRRTAAVAEIIA